MADSFFGFNTTLNDSDDGGGLDPSEDEYDALNDETFGAADDGDWEQQHEEFLLNENNGKRSDLEAYLEHLVLEDGEEAPAVPSAPQPVGRKSEEQRRRQTDALHSLLGLNDNIPPLTTNWLKNACTVEELEKNIRQRQRSVRHEQPAPPPPPPQRQQPPLQGRGPPPPPQQMHIQPPNVMMPVFHGRFPIPGMMAPGRGPHPFLGGPLIYRQPPPPPFVGGPMPPQHRPALPPFRMPMGPVPRAQPDHPGAPRGRLHPQQLMNSMMPPNLPQHHPPPAQPPQFFHHDGVGDIGKKAPQQQQQMQSMQNKQKQSWDNKLISELENADPDDPYGGLMTRREKRWLLNIQMMQLHTGTPYIDDYYYIMFMERKAKKEKQMIKEAHKANQQNHPFSQQNLNNRNHGMQNSNSNDGGRERRNSARSETAENRRNYIPMQFENSLGKLQCSSVTAPRKIIDMEVVGSESGETGSVHGGNAGVVGGASRSTRQTLLIIESLYRILLRLEDIAEPLAIANALILKERETKQKQLLQTEQMIRAAMRLQNDDDDHSSESPPDDNFLEGNAPIKIPAVSGSLGGTLPHSQSSGGTVPNLLDENRHDLLAKLFTGLLFEDRLAAIINVRKGKNLVLRILAQVNPQDCWRVPLNQFWPRLFCALPVAARREPQLLNPLVQHFTQYMNETEEWGPVSNLCQLLCENSTVINHQRSMTPAPHYKNLMHFLMSTTLGLSMLVALCERAAVLPKPMPSTWTSLIRHASDVAGEATGAARPLQPLQSVLLAMHTSAAGLPPPRHSALANLLC